MNAGIDLGTTFSLIGYLQADGRPINISDAIIRQSFYTPSSIFLGHGTALVGKQAEIKALSEADVLIHRFFKRQMGSGNFISIDEDGNGWTAEALSALLLRKLKHDYELQVGRLLERAVITVPAHFNNFQRKGVYSAAHMAGIEVWDIIDEPVAAAMHYASLIDKSKDKLVFVFDLGGGTFDATVLMINAQGIFVMAKAGDINLGGKEFDESIMQVIFAQNPHFKQEDISAFQAIKLRQAAEEIKIELSASDKFIVSKKIFFGDEVINVMVTRQAFESEIFEKLLNTIDICNNCIKDAGIAFADLDHILLIGGSSQIPIIKTFLRDQFKISDDKMLLFNPMEAVSLGATLRLAQLEGNQQLFHVPQEFKGICGYNISIKSFHATDQSIKQETLIRKNRPLPVKASKVFYTKNAEQQFIDFELFQYFDHPSQAVSIGKVLIGPILTPSINYAVEVQIEVLSNGTVRVKAIDLQTSHILEQTFHSYPDEDILMIKQNELVKNTIVNSIFG